MLDCWKTWLCNKGFERKQNKTKMITNEIRLVIFNTPLKLPYKFVIAAWRVYHMIVSRWFGLAAAIKGLKMKVSKKISSSSSHHLTHSSSTTSTSNLIHIWYDELLQTSDILYCLNLHLELDSTSLTLRQLDLTSHHPQQFRLCINHPTRTGILYHLNHHSHPYSIWWVSTCMRTLHSPTYSSRVCQFPPDSAIINLDSVAYL